MEHLDQLRTVFGKLQVAGLKQAQENQVFQDQSGLSRSCGVQRRDTDRSGKIEPTEKWPVLETH